ncbi:MAG: class I SAM-dependent methyltransferase [Candidatus Zambryskibacteria bacterium]|nr:class I SAM-dependent methyltransferase [Candidatus Zambryskibacteria bacterium]
MTILITHKEEGYELLDSGDGEKLERFGEVVLVRPDPEVLWKKTQSDEVWNTAHAHFKKGDKGAKWQIHKDIPMHWTALVGGVTMVCKIGNNKHVGVFPEQVAQWEWMKDRILKSEAKSKNETIKVLNLFAYTGGASMALASAGVEVTHVDASKASITWAHENKKSAGLEKAEIRFMLDDVRKFVERDIKRGVTYDAILMDPPVYGRGTKKQSKDQMWHIDDDLLPLLERSLKLLSKDPLFVVVTGYASEYSHLSYANALLGVLPHATIESGELAIEESGSKRLLPAGIFARATF